MFWQERKTSFFFFICEYWWEERFFSDFSTLLGFFLRCILHSHFVCVGVREIATKDLCSAFFFSLFRALEKKLFATLVRVSKRCTLIFICSKSLLFSVRPVDFFAFFIRFFSFVWEIHLFHLRQWKKWGELLVSQNMFFSLSSSLSFLLMRHC